jgi:hypothetical protein
MRQQRRRIVTTLAVFALTLAGAAGAETGRPGFDEALSSAADLYEKADWAGCARQYPTAAAMAPNDRQAARALLRGAMVFQHGTEPADYDRANQWAAKAVELDPDYPGARWLAAASKDRYLMWSGKPQLYGTQFKKDKDGPWYLWQVDPAITDEERAKWDVPPLARAKARVEALNAGTFDPH